MAVPVAKGYYRGGFRALSEGVPIRLARKPGKNYAKALKADKPSDPYEGLKGKERADARAKDAVRLIEAYATALGISVRKAKNKIEAQRLAVLDSAPRDLSLEFDL